MLSDSSPTLRVTYGYGTEAELQEAGADHVVDNPGAVEALIKALCL
jgi:phosphoglycolate phosphatase-like HAD superfamily hydrolase